MSVPLPDAVRDYLAEVLGWVSPQPFYYLSDSIKSLLRGIGCMKWEVDVSAVGSRPPVVADVGLNKVPYGYEVKPLLCYIWCGGNVTVNALLVYFDEYASTWYLTDELAVAASLKHFAKGVDMADVLLHSGAEFYVNLPVVGGVSPECHVELLVEYHRVGEGRDENFYLDWR